MWIHRDKTTKEIRVAYEKPDGGTTNVLGNDEAIELDMTLDEFYDEVESKAGGPPGKMFYGPDGIKVNLPEQAENKNPLDELEELIGKRTPDSPITVEDIRKANGKGND